MNIHAKSAFIGDRWAQNVRIECANGLIARIETAVQPDKNDRCVDVLLPALANLHSHSFQRAMAGMTEYRGAGRDSFWTWRDLLYRFLDHLTPDRIGAIAALVFMEMQEAGYASVGEFHYVHHLPGGTPYDSLSELSDRIFAATQETGIGLTHLPVLYSYGGVNKERLEGGQLRFANDVEQFLRLVESCKTTLQYMPADAQVGIAPHSLRATSPRELAQLLEGNSIGPVHIHISEQLKEVRDVQAVYGARPVEWLLDNAEVNHRWCLIHATHMTETETTGLAQSGAVAGLCPITEANLGDGVFNGSAYLEQGGRFGIGSDSNIRISLTEELRMLEYSQRLRDMTRNVMVVGEGSVGRTLYTNAALGGAQALGRNAGEIAKNKLADLVAINRDHNALCALTDDQLLDGLCFVATDQVVTDTWSAGRHVVQSGRHIARDAIVARYQTVIANLIDAL